MTSKVPGLAQVVKRLYELHCCARCVLRFTGIQNSASLYTRPYQEVVQYVTKEYEYSPDSSGTEETTCVLCLGLLQQYAETVLVKKICDLTKLSSHEFNNFTMAVYSPLVVTFRHHSIWIYLQENFRLIYPNEIPSAKILSVKECMKFVYGPRMEHDLDVEFNRNSPFTITVTMIHNEAMKELDFLSHAPKVLKCHPRKRQKVRDNEPTVTNSQVLKCIENLKTIDEFRRHGPCPPKTLESSCEISSVKCTNDAVYIAGRYTKYSRTLSQSPWIVNNQRMTESSVQELISAEIEKVFQPDEARFSSAGREDVDVRMLGKGRPFILELINPHKVSLTSEESKELQKRVNESTKDVQIRDLQKVTREDTSKLKEAENSKTKSYSALVYVPGGVTEEEIKVLDSIKDLKLSQKTPLRVLHRRPLADRERTVLTMSTELVDKNHFKLGLCTEAGTYIKEFVHGDFGRTKPNLGIIMKSETDILELDVESVDVDWPPYIDL